MHTSWRNRFLFLIAWLLSVVSISFYGGVVSYGIFALLTLLPVVSLCYLLCVIATFKIYQEIDSKWVVANHKVPFYLSLVNERLFSYVGIRVRFHSSFSAITGLDDRIEYELPPKSGIRKQTEIICRYRGEYEVGIKKIEVQDYFRLFRLSYFNKEPIKAVVRPEYQNLDRLRSFSLAAAPTAENAFRETTMDVLVRPYEDGDDIRSINWKVSARNRHLFVRKKNGEEQKGICLLFGTCRKSSDPFTYLPPENKLLETVLSLSLYLTKKQLPYKTLCLQKNLTQLNCASLEQFDTYYDKISGIEFDPSLTDALFFENALRSRALLSSRLVMLVIQKWTEETIRFCHMLNENDVAVCIYLIGNGASAGEADAHDSASSDADRFAAQGMAHVSVTRIDVHQNLREVL